MSTDTPQPLVLEGELYLSRSYEGDLTVVPEGKTWVDSPSIEEAVGDHFFPDDWPNGWVLGRYRITVERLS